MNIHILQYLASYVARCGPLWAYSCLVFKNMNACVKCLVHGTQHRKEQMGCTLGLCYAMTEFIKQSLKEKTLPKEAYTVLQRLEEKVRHP